jgi:hypothetical protein
MMDYLGDPILSGSPPGWLQLLLLVLLARVMQQTYSSQDCNDQTAAGENQKGAAQQASSG